MVARDQPFPSVPLARERVAGLGSGAGFLERKRVEPFVNFVSSYLSPIPARDVDENTLDTVDTA